MAQRQSLLTMAISAVIGASCTLRSYPMLICGAYCIKLASQAKPKPIQSMPITPRFLPTINKANVA